ncbi:MAG: dihydrolipoyl dehydrogenase family protein [Desulforhopalus sp.]
MVMGDMNMTTDLLVIGSGPGGGSAARRGAELGLDVIVVDQKPRPGGSWLHQTCIPFQCLLHLAEEIDERKLAEAAGITPSASVINIDTFKGWKNRRIGKVSSYLKEQAHGLGILFISARARFISSTEVRLEGAEISRIRFRYAIIATGSSQHIPNIKKCSFNGRIMDLTAALTLNDIPKQLLVAGNDRSAVELAQIFAVFGSRVSLATTAPCLLPGVDPDLVAPLQKKLSNLFSAIYYQTHIEDAIEDDSGVKVIFNQGREAEQLRYDKLVISGYLRPNTHDLGLEDTAVTLDAQGFIVCDDRQKTSDERIFGVGDVTSSPMQADIAAREGRVAAEAAGGQVTSFDVRAIPGVINTIPQISWCGLTVEEAHTKKIDYLVQILPWKDSIRPLIHGQIDGLTKILIDPNSGRILGAGIVGKNSSELIGEAALAIEMGGVAEDLALTLHPHPTFSETLVKSAELASESLNNPTAERVPGS